MPHFSAFVNSSQTKMICNLGFCFALLLGKSSIKGCEKLAEMFSIVISITNNGSTSVSTAFFRLTPKFQETFNNVWSVL